MAARRRWAVALVVNGALLAWTARAEVPRPRAGAAPAAARLLHEDAGDAAEGHHVAEGRHAAKGHESEENSEADHGGEGPHGEGDEADDHGGAPGHHHVTQIGTTTAIMLLGFVAFVMVLFYLVNWHDKDIREYTWIVISSTISIFCSVLCFSSLSALVDYWMKRIGASYIVADIIMFLALWFLIPILTRNYKKWIGRLRATGTVGAHVTGFAAIHGFGTIQSRPPFSRNQFMSALFVLMFAVVAVVLAYVGSKVRNKLRMRDKAEEEGEDKWAQQAIETEDDAIGLCLSYLVSALARFVITGEVPSQHGQMGERTHFQAFWLILVGLICAALVGLVTHFVFKNKQKEEHNHVAERVTENLQILLGLTMSWCLYFGIQWDYFVLFPLFHKGVAGKLCVAIFVSLIAVLAVFLLDALGDGNPEFVKAVRSVITSLGLLVGISWENCFTLAVEEVANAAGSQSLVKTVIALILVAIVLPAWRLYILPKADQEVNEFYKGKVPPLTSLCTTWHPDTYEHECKSERYRKTISYQKAGTFSELQDQSSS